MDWAGLKKEYITSNISLRALADKHGISRSTVMQKSSIQGWVEARERFRGKAEAKIVEKAAEAQSDYRAYLYSIAYKMAKRIDKLADLDEIKPKEITGALKDLKDILDLKSDADLKEQDARIRKLEKEAAEQRNEAKAIVVRIEGADEGWTQ